MRRTIFTACAVLTAAIALPASAQLPYSQSFATDTASQSFATDTATRAETLAAYPDWVLSTNPMQSVPEDLRVIDGVLKINPEGNDSRIIYAHDLPARSSSKPIWA